MRGCRVSPALITYSLAVTCSICAVYNAEVSVTVRVRQQLRGRRRERRFPWEIRRDTATPTARGLHIAHCSRPRVIPSSTRMLNVTLETPGHTIIEYMSLMQLVHGRDSARVRQRMSVGLAAVHHHCSGRYDIVLTAVSQLRA